MFGTRPFCRAVIDKARIHRRDGVGDQDVTEVLEFAPDVGDGSGGIQEPLGKPDQVSEVHHDESTNEMVTMIPANDATRPDPV